MKYPYLLETIICKEITSVHKIEDEKILRYYIRFLDVLSSPSIVSLFDLDALKHTLDEDYDRFEKVPLKELRLFTDWPVINPKTFTERFPEFQENLKQKKIMILQ